MTEDQKRFDRDIDDLAATAVRLGKLGFVTSHGGNLSMRVDEHTVLITPTKVPKREIGFDDIVILDFPSGKVRYASGGRRPTGETPMHLHIFARRPDARTLIHAHPAVLTGFSMVAEPVLARALLPEPIIELGPVQYVDYQAPLSEELAHAFDPCIERSNAFIMRNHGVLLCTPHAPGRTLELLEMLEAMAQSVAVAKQFGIPTTIPAAEVEKLEQTIRVRALPMPGAPGKVGSLREIFE